MDNDAGVSGRATHEQSQQAASAVPVGIPDAAMMVPADVLHRRLTRYANSYRATAEKTSWWRRWRRGLFFGAWAAIKMEIKDLEELAAQAIETRSAMTAGHGPKDESAVRQDAP